MRMYAIDMLGSNLTEAGILLDVTRSIGTSFRGSHRGGGWGGGGGGE